MGGGGGVGVHKFVLHSHIYLLNPCLLGDVLKANLVAVVLRLAARGSTVLPGSEAGRGTRKTVSASLRQGEAFVLIVVFAVSLET